MKQEIPVIFLAILSIISQFIMISLALLVEKKNKIIKHKNKMIRDLMKKLNKDSKQSPAEMMEGML